MKDHLVVTLLYNIINMPEEEIVVGTEVEAQLESQEQTELKPTTEEVEESTEVESEEVLSEQAEA